MADINVERKQGGGGIWMWIIGLIVLALLVWGITQLLGGRDRGAAAGTAGDTTAYTGTQPAGAAPAAGAAAGGGTGAANDFVTFVEQRIEPRAQQQGQVDRDVADHPTTAEGLRRLAAALDDMARGQGTGTPIQEHTSEIRQQADRLERSGEQEPHSDMVRRAFDAAAAALAAIDGGTAHAQSVRQAAERILPTAPLSQQTAGLQGAFSAARDAVRSMTAGRA